MMINDVRWACEIFCAKITKNVGFGVESVQKMGFWQKTKMF